MEKCRRKRSEKREPWALSFSEAVKTGSPPATGSTRQGKRGWSLPVEAAKSILSGSRESKMEIPVSVRVHDSPKAR